MSPQKSEDEDGQAKETAEQIFERQVVQVAEEWRDTFKEAQFYIDELRQ